MIKLMTDSASDISPELEKELDIRIIPFSVAVGNKSYVSRRDFDNEGFYALLESSEEIPTTCQVTAFEFYEIYEEIFAQGYSDLITTLINAEGSATYANAVMAAERFFEAHPERRAVFHIHTLDSRTYTGGYGYPVVEGARMARAGRPAEEIVAYIRGWLEKATIYFAPFTLKYARKSGRIPSAAAFVGDAVGLKPIMRIFDHKIITDEKIRGAKKVVPRIVEKTLADMEPGSPYCVVYGSDKAVLEEMLQAITAAVGYAPADVYQIGAAIAINAGPQVIGTIFRGK